MTHPDQARVEGLIERLADNEALDAELRAELKKQQAFSLEHYQTIALATYPLMEIVLRHALSELLSLRASTSAPRAWAYEVATSVDALKQWAGWQWRVSLNRPEAPAGTIRNVTPLGELPTPSPSAVTREPSGVDPAYTDGPFFYVPMPLNSNGQGPEMDPAKVQWTQHEVWNSVNLSLGTFANEGVARWVAATLNVTPEPETQPVEGWQAIETAPKNPHKMLIIAQQREGGDWIICEAHWVGKGKKSAWYGPGDYGDDEFSQPYRPTYWQPLPSPPIQGNSK